MVPCPFLDNKDHGSYPEISWERRHKHSRSKQETFSSSVQVTNAIKIKVLLTVSPTIGITPQKECVSDAHCVVDIQIKLQITKEGRGSKRVILTLLSDFFLMLQKQASTTYLPFSRNLRIGTLALISWVFSTYAMNQNKHHEICGSFSYLFYELKLFFHWVNSPTWWSLWRTKIPLQESTIDPSIFYFV